MVSNYKVTDLLYNAYIKELMRAILTGIESMHL